MDDVRVNRPGCHTVGAVLKSLALHPIDHLIRRWNWKSALLSSLLRGALFFSTNLVAGWHAALGALFAEFVFRSVTSGFLWLDHRGLSRGPASLGCHGY